MWWTNKNILIFASLGIFLSCFLLSCQSGDKKSVSLQVAEPPQTYKPKIEQLTFVGENRQASWSPDLKNIIFVSSRFGQHINRQIYEMDLKNLKERRITHQIGDTAFPLYWPDKKKIVYSSTTDEIKERFLESHPEEPVYQPYDVYMSALNGSNIVRLTRRPGFDGHLGVTKAGSKIVYSSVHISHKSDDQQIMVMNVNNKSQNQISKKAGFHRYPSYSFDGSKILWVYQKNAQAAYWLVEHQVGKGNRVLLQIKAGELKDISYSPEDNTIVFSSDIEEPGNLEIYTLDLSSSCLKRLTYDGEEDSYPRISWDNQWVLFQSRRSGVFQVYKMEYKPPEFCLELKDPSILSVNFDNPSKN